MTNHETMISMASTGVGAVFTAIQTNPVYQVISLVVTLVGLLVTIISSIVVPLIKWYREAKKDGKITEDEKDEAIDILDKGSKEVQDHIDKDKHGQ